MNLKWGRRNSPSSSSSSFVSRPSLFSSWLSKFKKMVTSDPVPEPEAKPEPEPEPEHVHVKLKVNGKKKSRGVEGSVLYDATGGPLSSFRSSGSNGVREEESWRFSIKVKELTQEKKEKEIKTPRKGSMKFRRSMHRRVLEQELPKLDRELDEDHTHATPDFLRTNKVSEQKLKEVELKTEKCRKSYYISRELAGRRTKQFSKVRVQSPRPPAKMEIRKVKALQDLKRTRLKTKKKTEKFTSLESLAVVKCSFDPEKDFRESMMEMILEESISKPEELEELLACYLTLNDDECHDLIIKVFRQVWLDMNKTCFQAETHDEDGLCV